MDKCGFVVDYGSLKEFKLLLDKLFDHTLLLNDDDPLLWEFVELEKKGACRVVTLPYGIGMEGTAKYLCEEMDKFIREKTKGRAWCVSAESRENDKNSSIYCNPEAGFKGWL
jgi:6-pyruvoyltetrahydropterin/6-carboxytetrahydropterin synthase